MFGYRTYLLYLISLRPYPFHFLVDHTHRSVHYCFKLPGNHHHFVYFQELYFSLIFKQQVQALMRSTLSYTLELHSKEKVYREKTNKVCCRKRLEGTSPSQSRKVRHYRSSNCQTNFALCFPLHKYSKLVQLM